ncbi:hypothetical protein LXA43DRAFT_888599 [Ganoderma leucocontextum]|nr:hypothetical protein LXA43DRAFT_888599 [Ganoderma leucocontextum]
MSDPSTSHISAARPGISPELFHTVAPVLSPATDHQPSDADPPTTGPAPTTDPQLNPRPSFVRNCPSSTNRDAYKKKSGRQLAPLLIDESGMGARFHLLDNDLFAARIPGDAPTDVDRKKFKSPKLKKGMLERDIYPQLGAVVQSVLKAAKCKTLRFLDTANHKAKDGNRGRTETFNDAGIYRDTPLARHATDLDSTRRAKSKMSKEQLMKRLLGARSWFWMDVPIEVKGDEKNSAFYFKTKPKESWADSMHPAAISSHGDEKPGDAEAQEGDVQDQEQVEGVEEVDEAEEAGDEEMEEEDDDEGRDEQDDDEEEEGEGEGEDDDEEAQGGFEDDIEDFEGVEEDEDFDGENEDEVLKEREHLTAVADIVNKPVPPFIKLSDNGEKALGQFVEYQLNLFKYQHRTFCYSIYVCFDMARLLYFDRAGAYVSEPFSWVETTSLLHEFVWKFAKLANANKLGDMGHDTTTKVVLPGTRRKFMKEAKNPALAAHIRAGLKKAAENACPLYELTVEDVPPSPDEWFPDEPFPELPSPQSSPSGSSSSSDAASEPARGSTPSARRFIVGRPHFSADALVGRCTKGYMAFDVTNPKKWIPCFLKDSWRPFAPRRTRPEHLVYERLRRMNVGQTDGIATLICGGDVGGTRAQCTRVQKDLPDTNRPVPRIHYRLVTEDIGLPLSEFDNFSELSAIFVDALRAHRKAWDLAGVLHRDISVGNIMIRIHGDGKRSGFLIDWDLSRLECELAKGPVEPDRTGTWQFRSALSLRYPRKPYRRSDDIESFVHAYMYLVLRYHPTSVGSLKLKVESLFEGVSLIGGIKIGGDDKLMLLRAGQLGFEVTHNISLQQLLDEILEHCKRTYAKINYPEMERLYGPIQTPAQPTHHGAPAKTSRSRNKPSVLRASDDEAPSAADTETDDELELHSRTKRRRRGASAQPAAPTDPCKIGAFLSNPKALMKLLAEHAEEAYELDDKAPDQFVARKIQDVFRPSEHTGLRSIGTLSITGSFRSEHASEDAPSAWPSDMFTAGSGLNLVGGAVSSDSPATSKKRTHVVEEIEEEDVADDEAEDSDSVRRRKRAKGRTGEVSRGRGNKST